MLKQTCQRLPINNAQPPNRCSCKSLYYQNLKHAELKTHRKTTNGIDSQQANVHESAENNNPVTTQEQKIFHCTTHDNYTIQFLICTGWMKSF